LGDAVRVEMYVNGAYACESEVTNNVAAFEVQLEACEIGADSHNVVSFITYKANDVVDATTYAIIAVKQEEETTAPEETTVVEETTAPEVTTTHEITTQIETTSNNKGPGKETVTSKPVTKSKNVLAKAKIKRITKKKKYIRVSLKKIKKAKGYRVVVYKKKSDAKKNKKAIYKKNVNSTKIKINKKYLKHKKNVYIKVRGYIINSRGKKNYGAWSKIKRAKVKY
jgi:dGTP triphosphohydrolase